jgi:hypothetical protein
MEFVQLLLCLSEGGIEGVVCSPLEIPALPRHHEPAGLEARYQGDFAVARCQLPTRRAKCDALQPGQEFLPNQSDHADLLLASTFLSKLLFLADGADTEGKEYRRRYDDCADE